ncbi:MAG TPA: helix-turn-helix domain-containing protein [bacterium]|nr:helix-turn-helix domain-containing protein [bacterium]
MTQVAEKLGVSRTYVLKLISSGKLVARKVGKTYSISDKDLPGIFRPITEAEAKKVERAVDQTLRDFGDVIKKLGKT